MNSHDWQEIETKDTKKTARSRAKMDVYEKEIKCGESFWTGLGSSLIFYRMDEPCTPKDSEEDKEEWIHY